MLAHAINERLDELAPPRAPYSDDFMPVEYLEEYLWDGEPGESS
jgi:hypothetical protein